MISLSDLAEKLKREQSVALFIHVRPDGDCIGSALALKFSLETLGVRADVYCDDAVPSRFLFLNGAENIKNCLENDYTALVAVDCADITRLGSFAQTFLKHTNTYNIDHHISNNHYAKINYVMDNARNSENAYELMSAMGGQISKEIANCLATGIMTDTGGFRHRNVTEQTLQRAAILVSFGADLNKISYKMFSEQSKERAKLFAIVMQKIRYFLDDRFALATIRLSDIALSGAKPDETEGFIDFVMGINTVEVGACVMEIGERKFKVSFRSKGADVNAVASTFGGGGHTLASGCQIFGDYEEVVDKIRFAVSRELPE